MMTVATQLAPHSKYVPSRNPVPISAPHPTNMGLPWDDRKRRPRKVRELSKQHAHLAELITSCAMGDRAAFRRLYDQTVRFVFSIVRSVLNDSTMAEEAAQEVYLTIWKRASSFNTNNGTPLAWIGTIARNGAIDFLRAERARGFISYSAEIPDIACDDRSAHLTVEAIAVRRALANLRPDFRNALMLSYFKGYTHAELAVVLDVPMGPAKSWVQRGLAALNKALQ